MLIFGSQERVKWAILTFKSQELVTQWGPQSNNSDNLSACSPKSSLYLTFPVFFSLSHSPFFFSPLNKALLSPIVFQDQRISLGLKYPQYWWCFSGIIQFLFSALPFAFSRNRGIYFMIWPEIKHSGCWLASLPWSNSALVKSQELGLWQSLSWWLYQLELQTFPCPFHRNFIRGNVP